MTMSRSKTEKQVATELVGEYRSGRTWREIAREDYANAVKPGTLNRIAKSGGRYFPKDQKIRHALGLSSLYCRQCNRKIAPPRKSVKPEQDYMRWWRNGLTSKQRRALIYELYLKLKKPEV